MFRSSNRLLRKGRAVVSRFLSQESVSLSREGRSYAERFPPLFRPLPEFNRPSVFAESERNYPTEITTLSNGLKIASEDLPGPAACVGIFVDSGSVNEKEGETGISHLLERLAFKDTKNRTHLQIVREVEVTGGNVGAAASREQMGYSYETLKANFPQAVELLIDCIRNPIFLESEVKDQLSNVREDIGELTKDPQKYLLESLHLAGFIGAIGKSLVAAEENFQKINRSTIAKFYFENYTPDRMVLSACGVPHKYLVDIAEPLLSDLQVGPTFEVLKSKYVGGDFRHKADSEVTHVALAFEAPGGWREDNDATALTVLQTMMGGGGSFSSGGPGKGMHSRLYLRVLNKYQQVQSFSAFSSVYNDTGLFGIHSTTASSFAAKAVEIAASELIAVATPGQVTELELHRAKNATKSAILMNLESRAIVTEDIGRQILTYGCRKPVDHFLKCIDELTIEDISNLAQKILSTPPTIACWGDVDSVPSYDQVSSWFQK